jgi:hypothetical protein
VSAVTVGVPNPGHTWSEIECNANTLCIDTVNKRLGIGTNNPAKTLDVVGDASVSGQLYVGGSLITPSSLPSPLTCPVNWIDSGHGFCVMKYEASNVGGVAISSGGVPWVSITQTAAATACSNLGSGYHLITNTEWMLLARDIESVATNWSGGTVGSGVLARGWTANTAYGDTWTNTAVASSSGASCLYNTAADTCGSTGTFLYKRTHTLTNGQTIWDLSGNVYEWTNDTCTTGTGTGYWQGAGWIEWNDTTLTDYEKVVAGPAGSYTSTNATGRYYGCSANGNAFLRSGGWNYGSDAGVFNLFLYYAPTISGTTVGFRCAR